MNVDVANFEIGVVGGAVGVMGGTGRIRTGMDGITGGFNCFSCLHTFGFAHGFLFLARQLF
jgi:hypothetical protein